MSLRHARALCVVMTRQCKPTPKSPETDAGCLLKVNVIEAVIPKVFGDIASKLADAEKTSSENFGALRTVVSEEVRPQLKDLGERMQRAEEKHQDSLGVIKGISPALAGIETRLAAGAISLQSHTRAEVSWRAASCLL